MQLNDLIYLYVLTILGINQHHSTNNSSITTDFMNRKDCNSSSDDHAPEKNKSQLGSQELSGNINTTCKKLFQYITINRILLQ